MNYIERLVERVPELSACAADMETAVDAICRMHRDGGKLLLCGNGGSAADCEHISGELLKGFILRREHCDDVPALLQRGVCAVPLPSLSASISAFANDVEPCLVYAQLVYAMGRQGDVFMGLSTSGNSKNVVEAARVAKTLGLVTVGLTGAKGGLLADICDFTVRVPETETYRIQEYHLPVYHAICAQVEEQLFNQA